MKTNRVILIIGFLFFLLSLEAQVVFQKYWTDAQLRNIESVHNFAIVNSQAQEFVGSIEIQVKNSQFDLELSSKSNVLRLKPGSIVNSTDLNWNNKIDQGASYAVQKLLNTGKLIMGDYSICYNFIRQIDQRIVGESCFEASLTFDNTLLLLSPIDNAVLSTLYPPLLWTQLPDFDPSSFKYSLKIVEVTNGQTNIQAINNNTPLLHNSFLTDNFYSYTQNDSPLFDGKSYAWQIKLLFQGQLVAETDIWRFTIDTSTPDDPPPAGPTKTSFAFTTSKLGSDYFIAKDSVRFAYYNRNYERQLDYRIIDKNNYTDIPDLNLKPTIDLVGGVNYISIPVSLFASFIDQRKYIIEITSRTGKKQFFNFLLYKDE